MHAINNTLILLDISKIDEAAEKELLLDYETNTLYQKIDGKLVGMAGGAPMAKLDREDAFQGSGMMSALNGSPEYYLNGTNRWRSIQKLVDFAASRIDLHVDDLDVTTGNGHSFEDSYKDTEIYGFSLNMVYYNPALAIQYIGKNTNFKPAGLDDNNVFQYGDWEGFIKNFLGAKPCLIKTDTREKIYLNPNNYKYDLDGNDIYTTYAGPSPYSIGKIWTKWWNFWTNIGASFSSYIITKIKYLNGNIYILAYSVDALSCIVVRITPTKTTTILNVVSSTSSPYEDIVYANGIFVLISKGYVKTTVDFATYTSNVCWYGSGAFRTPLKMIFNTALQKFAIILNMNDESSVYSGYIYVSAGSDPRVIYTSTKVGRLRDIAFNKFTGVTCVVTINGILRSTDMQTWEVVNSSPNCWKIMCTSKGKFITYNTDNDTHIDTLLMSSDGLNWSSVSMTYPNNLGNYEIIEVGDMLMYSGPDRAYSLDDGITWNRRHVSDDRVASDSNMTAELNQIAYDSSAKRLYGSCEGSDFNKFLYFSVVDPDIYKFNIFMEFPKKYFKMSIDGTILTFKISDKDIDGTYCPTTSSYGSIPLFHDDFMYIAVYEGCLYMNQAKSISGQMPNVYATIHEFFKYRNNIIAENETVSTYSFTHITQYSFLYMLLLLISKSTDLINNFGKGNSVDISNARLTTGLTDSDGLFSGTVANSTSPMKAFGIENLWGNENEFLIGLMVGANGIPIYANGTTVENDNISYYYTKSLSNSYYYKSLVDGFITSFELPAGSETFVLLPNGVGGSSATNECAYIDILPKADTTGVYCPFVMGLTNAGVFLFLRNQKETLRDPKTGFRLTYYLLHDY